MIRKFITESTFCFCFVILHVVINFKTIIRLQDIESLLLRWAVLEQIQWDSWAGPEQFRQLDVVASDGKAVNLLP